MKIQGVSEVRIKKPSGSKPARGKGQLTKIQQRRRAIDLTNSQNTRNLGTRVPESLAQALEAAAEERKMSVSEYLRTLITDELHRNSKPAMNTNESAHQVQARTAMSNEVLHEVRQLREEVKNALFRIHKENEQLIGLSKRINWVLAGNSS